MMNRNCEHDGGVGPKLRRLAGSNRSPRILCEFDHPYL
jgi:hypothetical protein